LNDRTTQTLFETGENNMETQDILTELQATRWQRSGRYAASAAETQAPRSSPPGDPHTALQR
jgi:hypothetical protein